MTTHLRAQVATRLRACLALLHAEGLVAQVFLGSPMSLAHGRGVYLQPLSSWMEVQILLTCRSRATVIFLITTVFQNLFTFSCLDALHSRRDNSLRVVRLQDRLGDPLASVIQIPIDMRAVRDHALSKILLAFPVYVGDCHHTLPTISLRGTLLGKLLSQLVSEHCTVNIY